MPYRICKTFEVENGHMLSKHPDLCRFPHGHTRRVEIVVESEGLDENEMVCDFKAVKGWIREYLDALDHAMCMNTEDPAFRDMQSCYGDRIVGFEGRDPTTEVMAEAIFLRVRAGMNAHRALGGVYGLRDSVRLVSVRLWETSSSWAEYSE
jgi:6-pyruvoyltetrahydropterin/6-carboxytetrahydropterin synthase